MADDVAVKPAVKEPEFKDAKGNELKVGAIVLVPFRVVKLAGSRSPLIHLESVHAYGHVNPNDDSKLRGRTKTAFWAEPDQVELPAAE